MQKTLKMQRAKTPKQRRQRQTLMLERLYLQKKKPLQLLPLLKKPLWQHLIKN
jgi:hypothetical protein